PDHFYVYPSYLERGGPRRLGRRVPASDAVAEAPVDAIVAAARSLGFTAEAEGGKQYPRAAHRFAGRVKVQKKAGGAKTAALRQIAHALRASAVPAGSGP